MTLKNHTLKGRKQITAYFRSQKPLLESVVKLQKREEEKKKL